MQRTILIGDVHGCLEELDEFLKLAAYKSGDRLIFLGDLIDRGPDPIGCVRRARELGAESVLGNHEEKALRWRRHERRRQATGKPNPMRKPQAERQAQWEALSDDDLHWISNLPAHIGLGDGWIAVHAGFEPGVAMSEQRMDRVVRVRYVDAAGEMVPYEDGKLDQPEGTIYWTEAWQGPASVVYGHAVHSRESPRVDHCEDSAKRKVFCVGLDTGCVFGGHLTGMILIDNNVGLIVQVPAKREYHPPLAC